MNPAPVHLIPGPARHGVNKLARQLAEACGALIVTGPDYASLPRVAYGPVHLHVTDHLWGADPIDAARRIVALSARQRISVTLHDLPQPSDGEHQPARAAAYRAIAGSVAQVVVNSEHERALLRACGSHAAASVVPLPIDMLPPVERRPAGDRQVTLAGFVYPGKGHAEALDAAATLPEDVGVVALGELSAGCEWLGAALVTQAGQVGRRFEITGFVDDHAWTARLRSAGLPLAAHTHISASGSIGSWIAAGRRPLVADSAYAREVAGRAPSAITLYDDGRLAEALASALADPGSTWHDGDLALWGTPQVAARYREIWEAA